MSLVEIPIGSRSAENNYRPDIDGLRAIAVLSVVFYHAGVPFLKGGFVGVDIFFVISGFLIGAHVYSDIRHRRFRISEFYRKRAKRILPALLVVLLFCYVVALLILSPQELTIFGSHSVATILSISNIFSWSHNNYFSPDTNQNPLLMTWSLGVEEQFYVIFPLLMLLFATARRKYIFLGTLLVIAISLAACILGTPRNPTAVFYLLPTRAWELAFGVLLAIYEKGRISQSLYLEQRLRYVLSTIGILLIAIGIFVFNSHTSFPGYAALLPVCGTVCMLTAPGGWANRLLSTAPFVFIGQISYSLYLWHWPLLSFSRIISDHPISVTKGCAIVAISIPIAWLSYRFVEQPCRRSKTPTGPLLLRYALLCAILIVPAMLFRTSAGLPQRFPKLQPVIAYRDWELDKCSYVTSFDQPSFCIDVHDLRPAIALFGDSHAQTISSPLRELANQSGYKMYELVKFVCAPLTGVVSTQKLTHGQECIDHNAKVISFLQHDPNVKFVVLAANWEGPDLDDASYVPSDRLNSRVTVEQSHQNLLRGLAATIATLQSAGKQVVLIQDVPIFTFDPMRRILSMYIPLRGYLAHHLFPPAGVQGRASLSETLTAEGNAAAAIINTVAATQQSSVFDPKPNLCAPDCLFFRGQYPIFFDREHVTPIGAQLALTGLTFPPDPKTIPTAMPASTQPPQSSTKPPTPWSRRSGGSD